MGLGISFHRVNIWSAAAWLNSRALASSLAYGPIHGVVQDVLHGVRSAATNALQRKTVQWTKDAWQWTSDLTSFRKVCMPSLSRHNKPHERPCRISSLTSFPFPPSRSSLSSASDLPPASASASLLPSSPSLPRSMAPSLASATAQRHGQVLCSRGWLPLPGTVNT